MFLTFTKVTKVISFALLSVLLLGLSAVCMAREDNYIVTKSELNNMKHYISVIKQEKQQLLSDLENSKISLQQAEKQRKNLENQLNEALNTCSLLEQERKELETLSKDLKEQFDKLRKEAESKIKKLTMQRNLAVIVGIILGLI